MIFLIAVTSFRLFRDCVRWDTVHEVKYMVDPTSTPDKGESASSARYRRLPERIRPEDMIATQETEPPPDPTMGRDAERDFMLRNAGF